MMKQIYLWKAATLEGVANYGTIGSRTGRSAIQSLRDQGYFQISLTPLPHKVLNSALSNKETINILDSLTLLLDSGISMIEALDLLVNDDKSSVSQYVFTNLRNSLHGGKSLEKGFAELIPLFSGFFLSMIGLCEKTGNLRQGLHALGIFYKSQETRRQEFQNLIRYPKIVLSITLLLSFGIVFFIIPMFENIYALFKGDLPILTRGMVFVSDFLHRYIFAVSAIVAGIVTWANLPQVSRFHPVVLLSERIRKIFQSREDPFLYAHAMKILLESGQPINLATKQAAGCMSNRNRRHGLLLDRKLSAGFSFSEAFQEVSWFPTIFRNYIASAEKAGLLKVGFEQVYNYINRRREEDFAKWSKFVEPVLMLVLGTIILTLLLSIYLPIFELGNKVG
ncbi:MAG: type II secretion system F family protein [Proteobacteria bacterium]|nr:type II secretion system F family protein [Pseudomonadota bacterium]